MNGIIILLVVMAILFRVRQQGRTLMSTRRILAIFGAVLLMHVIIVGGLVVFNQYGHF